MSRSDDALAVLAAFHVIRTGDRVVTVAPDGRRVHGFVERIWNEGADFDVSVDGEPHHLIRYLDEVVYDPA